MNGKYTHNIIIWFLTIAIIILGLVTLYEFCVVKNPFFDAVPPMYIWGAMFLVMFLFAIKVYQAFKEN